MAIKEDGEYSQASVYLCNLLATKIKEHGKLASNVVQTPKWQKDMTLLLKRGPLHTEPIKLSREKIEGVINDTFSILTTLKGTFCWADQIRCPYALRDHWHQLVIAIEREQKTAIADWILEAQ